MAGVTRWEYVSLFCWYKITKKGKSGLFGSSADEGMWTIRINDQEFTLGGALDHMGNLGWELVTVQQAYAIYGGGGDSGYYYPSHLYTFKRPLGE